MADDVVELLREMVAIPSISPGFEKSFDRPYGERDMADFVLDWGRKNGLDTEKRPVLPARENVIARLEGQRSDTVVLCSHLDTVDVQNMTINPFDPVVKDGRVWGRGSCDDKASLAAMMMALAQLARLGKPQVTFVLAATCAEEQGQYGSAAVAEELRGVRAAIVGEPTGLNVVRAHKGAIRWRMTTSGKRVHSSAPHKGVNAVYRMGRLLLGIEAYQETLSNRRRHRDLGAATISVGTIHGGEEVNSVPDRCVIHVDRRLLPGETTEEATADLRGYLTGERGIDFDMELEALSVQPPMECSPEDPVLKLILACAKGREPQAVFTTAAYCTDAASLGGWGCPTPVIGPGDIAQAHTAAEHIDILQLRDAVHVYRAFAEKVAGIID